MTKVEFNNVFRMVVSKEFETVPVCENEITNSFSQNFEQRMEKLIRSERKISWHWINTTGKRVAIIVVALLCVLSAAFSAEAVREPVVNFIMEIFDGFWRIRTESEMTREITYECIPNYIPDGYTLYEENKTFYNVTRTYINASGDLLKLYQDATIVNEFYMDNEHGEVSRIIVDGKEVILYKGTDQDYFFITWVVNGYSLSVTSYGNLSEDVILEIVRNFK